MSLSQTAYNPLNATSNEEKVLGALLLEPNKIVPMAEEVGLRSKHFETPIHAKFWSFLFGRAKRGETIEPLELAALCPKELKELNGAIPAVNQIGIWLSDTPSTHHFRDHAGLVIEAESRRRTKEDLSRAIAKIEAGDNLDEVAEILSNTPTITGSAGLDKKEGLPPLSSFLVDHSSTIGMTWEQIEALRPPFVIDGFVRQGEVLLLGAESKSRKSWLAQDAGLAVAMGIPWLPMEDDEGQSGFKTEAANVHVFDLELSSQEVLYRFAKARGNAFPDDLETQSQVSDRFHSYSLEGEPAVAVLAHLEEMTNEVKAGDLVIIDCLYRLQADGNETQAVAEILESVKRFTKKTQAAVIVVDHFRKAGAEKARDRLAGTYVKQAAPSAILAIEVKGDDVLQMTRDNRTFHGTSQVHARFNPESYRFNQIPEEDVKAERDAKENAKRESWLAQVWGNKSLDAVITNADAKDKWKLSRQAADTRFNTLEKGELVELAKNEKGKAKTWRLATEGRAILARNLNLHPTLHPKP